MQCISTSQQGRSCNLDMFCCKLMHICLNLADSGGVVARLLVAQAVQDAPGNLQEGARRHSMQVLHLRPHSS